MHNAKINEYSHIKIYKPRRINSHPAHKISQNVKLSKYLYKICLTLLNNPAIIQHVK